MNFVGWKWIEVDGLDKPIKKYFIVIKFEEDDEQHLISKTNSDGCRESEVTWVFKIFFVVILYFKVISFLTLLESNIKHYGLFILDGGEKTKEEWSSCYILFAFYEFYFSIFFHLF